MEVEQTVGLTALNAAMERIDLRKKEIDGILEAIETVVWLFESGSDSATVQPRRKFKARQGPSEIARTTNAIVRERKAAAP
jgi:hypothetical protein